MALRPAFLTGRVKLTFLDFVRRESFRVQQYALVRWIILVMQTIEKIPESLLIFVSVHQQNNSLPDIKESQAWTR
jgi:hypothetical protein